VPNSNAYFKAAVGLKKPCESEDYTRENADSHLILLHKIKKYVTIES